MAICTETTNPYRVHQLVPEQGTPVELIGNMIWDLGNALQKGMNDCTHRYYIIVIYKATTKLLYTCTEYWQGGYPVGLPLGQGTW